MVNVFQIYVQINDNDQAFTIYEIEQSVTVLSDMSNIKNTEEKLILEDSTFYLNKILNEGDYLESVQELQILFSLINEQSLSDKKSLSLSANITHTFPQIYGPLENYSGVAEVKNQYEFFFILRNLCIRF